ncbi:MAG: SRPBCC family protein [Alphaproteobacteria bacterium]
MTAASCPGAIAWHLRPRIFSDFYFTDATPSDCEEEAIRYIDDVLQVEDIGLVESVQRGLHSRGYGRGRFMVDAERSQLSEHAVHHFHALVLDALAE